MTLRELLATKLIHENAVVMNLDDRREYNEFAAATAIKVFNRPVEIADFKPNKVRGCDIQDCLDKDVIAIFGSTHKYKVVIQVGSKKS